MRSSGDHKRRRPAVRAAGLLSVFGRVTAMALENGISPTDSRILDENRRLGGGGFQ